MGSKSVDANPMERTVICGRGVLPVAGAVIVACLSVSGCDKGIVVSGTLQEVPDACKMSLWTKLGPVWGTAVPKAIRTTSIRGSFEVAWTIGGPEHEHWVEVECPGHQKFTSKRFSVPKSEQRIDLGHIELKSLTGTP